MGLPQWTADQAATVQAVAAVWQTIAATVALGIAVGVPLWQGGRERRRSENDRRLQASTLAFILGPGLLTLGAQLDEAETNLRNMNPAVVGSWKRISLQTPAALRYDRLDRTHILGRPAVLCITRLLAELDRFNNAKGAEAQLAMAEELRGRLEDLMVAVSWIGWPDGVSPAPDDIMPVRRIMPVQRRRWWARWLARLRAVWRGE